jgi:hypothetical protein
MVGFSVSFDDEVAVLTLSTPFRPLAHCTRADPGQWFRRPGRTGLARRTRRRLRLWSGRPLCVGFDLEGPIQDHAQPVLVGCITSIGVRHDGPVFLRPSTLRAGFSLTDLGIDQEPYHLDEFTSQARSAKRYGMAVRAINQKCELITELTRIARAESTSE